MKYFQLILIVLKLVAWKFNLNCIRQCVTTFPEELRDLRKCIPAWALSISFPFRKKEHISRVETVSVTDFVKDACCQEP